DLDRTQSGMLDSAGDAEVLDLRIGKDLVHRIDRATGDTGLVQQFYPMLAGLLAGSLRDLLVQRRALRRSRFEIGEPRVGQQLFGADRLAEALVQRVAGGGDVYVTVGGLEDAGGDARRMIVARLLRDLAGDEPARRLEVHHLNERLEQRGVDPLAFA